MKVISKMLLVVCTQYTVASRHVVFNSMKTIFTHSSLSGGGATGSGCSRKPSWERTTTH